MVTHSRNTNAFVVRMVPIGDVIPYGRNPRKNARAVAKVAGSLREFGWRQPIVVDEAMTVIVGHTRLEAARTLGMTEVPVHVATGLTPQQVKAYRIADNRTGAEALWDGELLALELAELKGDAFDLGLTGFDPHELDALLGAALDADDPTHWDGMPEFEQHDKRAYRTIPVHFKDEAAVAAFAEAIGQKITEKTRFVWYPEIEIERYADKRYSAE